eukprot:scaffold576_cov260-Pinguiococcus_pyrenoidosus.AAC.27
MADSLRKPSRSEDEETKLDVVQYNSVSSSSVQSSSTNTTGASLYAPPAWSLAPLSRSLRSIQVESMRERDGDEEQPPLPPFERNLSASSLGTSPPAFL